jgi:glyoxylase-like metal-dependent hydrolase (beta-lactamase superfamily II)
MSPQVGIMRLFSKILGGGLVLGLILAAIALVPPHLQVRSVEPALPDMAGLRTLLSVENGPVRLRYVNTSSQALPQGELGHTVFLVEWANGNLFMIDAGMDRKAAVEFGKLMETALSAEEAVSHGSIAEILGEDTMRVMGVAYTHLHIDHAQGTVPFCAARGSGASVFQTSWQSDLHNFNTVEGAAIVADSCLEPGTLGEGVIMAVEGFPGIGIVALGGHTPGSTLFAVAVGDRLWLLSGDISNSKADLLSKTGKGFLYSYLLVPEHTGRNDALRSWLGALDADEHTTVIVSHDVLDIASSGMAEYSRPRSSGDSR